MRAISATILEELVKTEFRPFYLLKMVIDGIIYRYTDCDVPIRFAGNKFEPRGFSIDTIQYSSGHVVDSLSFSIDNLDNYLTGIFVGGSPRNSEVELMLVMLDEDYKIVTVEAEETVDLDCFWEVNAITGGIQPIIGESVIVGLWESRPPTTNIIPYPLDVDDDLWDYNAITGGIMPKEA